MSAWAGLAAILACGGNGGSGGGSSSNTGTVFIGPGFTPDPAVRTGQGGGPFDSTTYGSGCVGYVGAVRDEFLHLTGDFTYLRVVARSDTDIALVIRMSDGSYRCNDDAEGLNPVIEGPFPRGMHSIYVGSMVRGVEPNYVLGVSEMRTTMPSTLVAPTTP
ncbi:MAG: hypothetical protein H6719_06620 [Sandaracinaceae bacterium]|nr:hypothetical protein [Sandaracinaceae bacterium]